MPDGRSLATGPGSGTYRRTEREPRRRNLTLLLAAVAALGAVLALARQVTYGVALHWDSVNYIAVARNLLAGAGFHEYSGAVYVSWPPLYPLLLAVVSLDVLDPLAVAGPVNAALFALTIFVAGRYLQRRLESRFLAVWAALAIALAWPLAGLAAYALTGAAFILLVTLTLIHAEAYLAKGRTSSLVWAGAWAALAWQTRYLGAALPAAVAVALLLQRGARPVQRMRRAAGFSLLAGAPMALWLVRNRLLTGTFTGPRGNGIPPLATLSGAGEVLRSWATFDLPLVEWQAVAYLGLLPAASMAAAGGVLIRKRSRRRSPSDWLPCYLFGGFALTYCAVLAAGLSQNAPHGVLQRYVAPLYVPLLLMAAFALDQVLGFAPRRPRSLRHWKRRWACWKPQAAAAVVTAVLCFWTAGQIEPNVREIRHANTEGLAGWANSWWARSETRDWLRRNPLPGWVFSNDTHAVYVNNDASADGSAQFGSLPGAEEHLQRLLAEVPSDAWVVWFDNLFVNRTYDYDRSVLRATSVLEPVSELADGAVFKVRPSAGTAPADR